MSSVPTADNQTSQASDGQTEDSQTCVAAKAMSVRFGSTDALRDLTFTINRATSVALVGANGSGKTTLLNVIAGLAQPTSGDITIKCTSKPAFVLQHQDSQRWLPVTAGEVLRMGRYGKRGLLGRIKSEDRDAIANAAKELEVADLLSQQFGDLSGGQRQRVLVAQALVQQPDVLLMDEPITGLDLPSQQKILDLIDGATEAKRTIIISTHHLDEARHCDQVLLLSTELVAYGPPDEVLSSDNLRRAFGDRVLGDHADHDHANDFLVLDEHGHQH